MLRVAQCAKGDTDMLLLPKHFDLLRIFVISERAQDVLLNCRRPHAAITSILRKLMIASTSELSPSYRFGTCHARRA